MKRIGIFILRIGIIYKFTNGFRYEIATPKWYYKSYELSVVAYVRCILLVIIDKFSYDRSRSIVNGHCSFVVCELSN